MLGAKDSSCYFAAEFGGNVPISYTIDEEESVIYETWTGDIYAKDLQNYWTDYLQDPRVLAIRRTLVDLRESTIHFTGTQLSNLITNIVLKVLDGRDWKTAIVVERPRQYGLSRQYQVFADLYSNDSIFYDHEEALRWLLKR